MNIGDLKAGMKVRSADGTSLGKIVQVAGDTLIIEKGFFFPKDYTADIRNVSEVRDGEVWLSSRDDVLRGDDGWPSGAAAATMASSGAGASSSTGAREDIRVPLHEEELSVGTRDREAGEVRVRKEVVTEHKTVDVPVMREEVHVERVPVSASSAGAEPEADAFREKTISVPVHEEEIEIRKRPRVKEEVRISKEQHTVEQRAGADVRREEVEIDDTSTRGTTERGYGEPGRDDDDPFLR